ncbi:MAG TPA: protein-export chaperone SecB [Agitococcus sp.]|uniref:protein-export chaperone SecB n=1 Tax=uncultured Agitococcus sp. TaxID=1506599 RepID=UPI0026027184|nr:protein-export chaperone SecB [uncultured Agitococcus sp.]HNB18960.1 protein-export chaperone SecB [Agitococcus sp.]HNJ86783.1 protein-export chaperone SecB [Agitococcus sp.]HRH90567.1 protein-export chaperone SecB [Agitococcus sp.]
MSENQNQGGQFGLERLFVKDLSFEVPNSKVFLGEWKPEMDVQLNTETVRLDETHYEVSVTVTVTAKNAGATAFVAEVKQAGIFLIAGVPDEQLTQLVGAYCPNILFPYVREAISDLVNRGSFPQLLLAPVNFDALFAQAQQQRAEQAAQQQATLQ